MKDRRVARRKLRVLAEAADELARLCEGSFDEFRDSPERVRAAERLIQVIVQVCIDVCNLILVELESPPAATGRLAVQQGCSRIGGGRRLAGRLDRLVKLRNRLVHLYDRVATREAYDGARSALTAQEEFGRLAKVFLSERRQS